MKHSVTSWQIAGLVDSSSIALPSKTDAAEGGGQGTQQTPEYFLLPAVQGSVVDTTAATSTLQCELCGKTFQNMKTKSAHIKNLHQGVSFSLNIPPF